MMSACPLGGRLDRQGFNMDHRGIFSTESVLKKSAGIPALLANYSDSCCVLLYDDLPAELDAKHRKLILSVLSKMNIQLFLTAIEKQQIDLSAWEVKKMFHVEHGKLDSNV